jgi:predicted ribosome quality control (RQC) complex YloA/Tae2 family protein
MNLKGLRLGKSWRSGKALVIEAGKKFLVARPGGLYLSGYAPRGRADGFSMFLRKRITGKTVEAVRQHNLDRVVTLELRDCALVFELFSKGNVVYLEDGKVAGYLHPSKRFSKGGDYVPPESVDYLSMGGREFASLVEGKSKAEVARLLGIGKLVEDVWEEPAAMQAKLRELAGTPLEPEKVEELFKERDVQELYDREWEIRSAKRKKIQKSIDELKKTIDDYEARARRLENAATAIMGDLPRHQAELDKAFKKGKKRIKVSLSDN